jgi:flagellar biosynthetic protein FliP
MTALLALFLCGARPAAAQESPGTGDVNFSLNLNPGEAGGTQMSDLMKIVLVLSLLTLLPGLLLTMTAFTRIVIVLSFVRRALSVQQMPPNLTIMGLSLFLTAFVMAPTFVKINEVALQPAIRNEISDVEGIKRAVGPLRDFMLRQTRKRDLALFVRIARLPKPATADDVPTQIILPAFALSEIKTAFQMGFLVFLPMLVVDIVVAMLLTSMGMFMLPPAMVSIPLKILLFVLVDGWHLVIGSLSQSFM